MAFFIDEITALRRLDSTKDGVQVFESIYPPQAMGSVERGLAYGGCVAAMCVAAAYQATSQARQDKLQIYSSLGNFLGPASTKHRVRLHVTSLRDTRSFETRLIRASQLIDGKERLCMSATVDFIVVLGDRTKFSYSAQPSSSSRIDHHSVLPTYEEDLQEWLKRKDELSTADVKRIEHTVKQFGQGAERKFPRGSLWAANGYGVVTKGVRHGQDHLPLPDRRAYDWVRSRTRPRFGPAQDGILYPPTQQAANACFLALEMDAYMSFIPVGFSYQTWTDLQSVSSLDFALRFHSTSLDVMKWHLREMKTITAADERDFDESRLWAEDGQDEKGEPKYKLIATMNQAGIVRSLPPPPPKERL